MRLRSPPSVPVSSFSCTHHGGVSLCSAQGLTYIPPVLKGTPPPPHPKVFLFPFCFQASSLDPRMTQAPIRYPRIQLPSPTCAPVKPWHVPAGLMLMPGLRGRTCPQASHTRATVTSTKFSMVRMYHACPLRTRHLM